MSNGIFVPDLGGLQCSENQFMGYVCRKDEPTPILRPVIPRARQPWALRKVTTRSTVPGSAAGIFSARSVSSTISDATRTLS